MKRFMIALDVAADPPPLRAVSEGLSYAVREAEEEGEDPTSDPAVLLLGIFVAFRTHADVNTVKGMRKLIDLCDARITQRSIQ